MLEKLKKSPIGIHCILAVIYFVALPLTIPTNETGTASYLKYLTIPIAMYYVISIPFHKKKFHINGVQIAFSLYTLTTIFSLFVDSSYNSFLIVIGYILNAALLICITTREFNKKEIRLLENTQIILLCILCFLGIFGSVKMGERSTLEIFGAASDPNYFTGFFILPLTIAVERIIKDKYKIIYIPLIALSLYVILSTGSRGGLIAVATVLLISVLVYPKGFIKKIIALGLLAVALVIAWQFIMRLLPETVVMRFSVNAALESRGTYRFDIWKSMINEIKNSGVEIFFGRGINAQHTLIIGGNQYSVVAHNLYIQLMYNQGWLGAITFLIMIITVYCRNYRERKYIVIALTGMLALGLSLSLLPSIKAFWNLIMYAALSITNKTEELSDGNNNE